MFTRVSPAWIRALLVAVTCSLASACVVEDRNFDEKFAKERLQDNTNDSDDADNDDSDGTDASNDTETLCDKYCEEIMGVCVEGNAMFDSRAACLAACSTLEEAPPEGEKVENTNTVACRYFEVQNAKDGEAEFHCPRAAIASQVCGNPCETYCRMHPQVCGELPAEAKLEQDECERRCAGIPKTAAFSLKGNYRDDSIQCRLLHLVNASVSATAANNHCPHARIASPLVCGDEQEVSCKNYCATLAVACTGELTQYNSTEACEKTCMALPPGQFRDQMGETVACRHYHAYASLAVPEVHCTHAGPITDGHCGSPETSNCENYCTLARAACEAEFDDEYETTQACVETCLPLPGAAPDSNYPPVDSDGGDTQVVQRMIREATKVLGGEPGASCDGVIAPSSLLGL